MSCSKSIVDSNSLLYGYSGTKQCRAIYSALSKVLLFMATPMLPRPLSTNTTWPVMADASGEHRKAAAWPTCTGITHVKRKLHGAGSGVQTFVQFPG